MSAEGCNLCGADGARPLFRVHGRVIVACRGCGLRSFQPLPTAAELERLYRSATYHAHNYFQPPAVEKRTDHYQRFLEYADIAVEHCGKEPLIEVGPGQGLFLELMHERGVPFAAVEYGVERADELRARHENGEIHTGALEELDLGRERFAMAVSFDVIEHSRDPMAWLGAVHRLLKPGGLLALSTVSFDTLLDRAGGWLYRLGLRGPAARLYPPYHLYYFTPRLLLRYIAAAGFEPVELRQQNYDLVKVSSARLPRMALAAFYVWHDLTGRKTNLYLLCRRR